MATVKSHIICVAHIRGYPVDNPDPIDEEGMFCGGLRGLPSFHLGWLFHVLKRFVFVCTLQC